MIDDIILDHKLQGQGDQVGNGIIPGQTGRKPVEKEKQEYRENIWHVFHHRVALFRCHAHAIPGNKKTGDAGCNIEQTQVVTQHGNTGSKMYEPVRGRQISGP